VSNLLCVRYGMAGHTECEREAFGLRGVDKDPTLRKHHWGSTYQTVNVRKLKEGMDG